MSPSRTVSDPDALHELDPFDWSVEQVIHALCNPHSDLLSSEHSVRIPDSHTLANILREQEINGRALLSIQGQETLRDDLGIRAYGHRTNLLHLIEKLQQKSSRYHQREEQLSSRAVPSSRGFSQFTTPVWLGSPQHHRPEHLPPLLGQSPSAPANVTERLRVKSQGNVPNSTILDVQKSINTTDSLIGPIQQNKPHEVVAVDEDGRKRRRLVLGPQNLVSTLPASAPPANLEIATKLPQSSISEVIPSVDVPSEAIASEAVDAGDTTGDVVDPDAFVPEGFSDPTGAINETNEPMQETAIELLPGRKRIKPILISEPLLDEQENQNVTENRSTNNALSAHEANDQRIGRKSYRRAKEVYLGPLASPVDRIIYGTVAMEGKLLDLHEDDKDDFCLQLATDCARGHCLYVGNLMKCFFRAERLDFSKPGRKIIGVIPYPDRVSRKNHPLSMTIFSSDNKSISASRANRHRWTAIPDSDAKGEMVSSDIFHVAEPDLAMDAADDQNWTSLEKWKHIDNDRVLPAYGESGSEGEYDMETWNEMEGEGGQLKKPKLKSKSRQLPHNELEKVINDAIASYRQEWQSKKRPTFLPKAWCLWTRAKKDSTTQVQVAGLSEEINGLKKRIDKLHKEICKEQWTQVAHLRTQCKILQPSVFDQEEKEWRREILQLARAPVKILARSEKSKKSILPTQMVLDATRPLMEDEEALESSEDYSDGESDNSLADFIVDDETDRGSAPMSIDHDDQTMADDEGGVESDTLVDALVKEEVPAAKDPKDRSSQSPSLANFIDLTQTSDPYSTPAATQLAEAAARNTPPAVQSSEEEGNKIRAPTSLREMKKLRVPTSTLHDSREVISLDTDSDSPKVSLAASDLQNVYLPALDDIDGIRELKFKILVERQDRKRLLLWVLAHCKRKMIKSTFEYFRSVPLPDCAADVMRGLDALSNEQENLSGVDKETSNNVLLVTTWFVSWTIPTKPKKKGLAVADIRTTMGNMEIFSQFYEFLVDNIPVFERYFSSRARKAPIRQQRQQSSSQEDSDLSDTSEGDRKIFPTESQATLDRRGLAMQQYRENEQRKEERKCQEARRREQLKGRFSSTLTKPGDRPEVTINPGKLDDQDLIHLNPDFGHGTQLKTHQEEGLQFLWRELTTNHDDLQGCLLAQTMGLGKTIQVIALLVALTDAAHSENKNITDQIPVALRKSQTLILCPPTLIENWWDELLMWPPQSNHLGQIRKVSAALKLPERIAEIKAWNEEGGILLLGFPTFRELIRNKGRAGKKISVPAALNTEQHNDIKAALLDGPNLVVADEAHEIKNEKSNINIAVKQIKCKSRIALTGSPLSNNIQEYYALIDWISPGYLGEYKEFKATFEDPIQDGLWQESTTAERKESRKRLKALELELAPKVNRADPTALHNNLHGKAEFIIRVPLTPLQYKMYCDFIERLTGICASNEPRSNQLWSYIGALQLLCNHPKSYYDQIVKDATNQQIKSGQKAPGVDANFMKSPKAKPKKNIESSSSEEPDSIDEETAAQSIPGSLKAAQEVVGKLVEGIESLSHSYKMTTLVEIVRLSIAAEDKVLIFSQRIATLEYIGEQLTKRGIQYMRIAAEIIPSKRQDITKAFNDGSQSVCVISTKVGGQGLNLFSANRVIIMDEGFNPRWEQQAVGRAYRFGQKKKVYVYRLTVAGTFEHEIQNQSRFKEQLVTRVVDRRNPIRLAQRKPKEYAFLPKTVKQEDLSEYKDKDSSVLSHLLLNAEMTPILSITPFETFDVEDGEELTAQDLREAEQMQRNEQLRRQNPNEYAAMMEARRLQASRSAPPVPTVPSGPGASNTRRKMSFPSTMPAQPTAFASPRPTFPLDPRLHPAPQTASPAPVLAAANGSRSVLQPVPGGNTRSSSMSPEREHSIQASNRMPQSPSRLRTPPNGLPDLPLELPVRASDQRPMASAPSLLKSRESALKSVEQSLTHWTKTTPKIKSQPDTNVSLVDAESESRLVKSIHRRFQRDPFRDDDSAAMLAQMKNLVCYYAKDTPDYIHLVDTIVKILRTGDISVEDVFNELDKHWRSNVAPSSSKRPRSSPEPHASLKKPKTSAVPSPKSPSSGSTERMFGQLLAREANRDPRH